VAERRTGQGVMWDGMTALGVGVGPLRQDRSAARRVIGIWQLCAFLGVWYDK
jgi:hypothetical protein